MEHFILEQHKKRALIHYLEELLIILIGITIFIGLLWYNEFQFSLRIVSLWVFLFNGIIFSYWLWKSDAKSWEKAATGLYFLLVELIILLSSK